MSQHNSIINIAEDQLNGKEVLEFKKTNSYKYLSLPTHEKQWHVAELFQERLNSLNNLVKRRESLIHKVPGNEGFNDNSKNECGLKHGRKEDGVDNNQYEKLGCPHSLSERDPNLPLTDASKRLSLRFEDFQDETVVRKGSTHRSRNQGSNRILVNSQEKRNIEKQLESNSSKYLSRAANSLRFQVKKVPCVDHSTDCQQMTEKEDYPIPLGGFEMNPHLLLRLSCEKMAVDRGKGLMKLVSSNPISLDLYVYMYWFIHCRFFQVCEKFLHSFHVSILMIFISMTRQVINQDELKHIPYTILEILIFRATIFIGKSIRYFS